MPQDLPLTTEGILLNRHRRGENFLYLILLSPVAGILHAGKRVTSRGTSQSTPPDLFDEAALTFEPPRKGTGSLRFIREYRLTRRYDRIGRDYQTLSFACRYARVLTGNPLPETSAAHLHETLQRALHAWNAGRPAETVYFKALFLFARDEGIPAKEEWLVNLAPRDQKSVAEILRNPSAEPSHSAPEVKRLIALFEKYLRSEQDMTIPETLP